MSNRESKYTKHLVIRSLSEYERTQIAWLWYGWICENSICILSGRAGIGKSWLLCHLTSQLTRGYPLEGDSRDQDPSTVMWIGAEDDTSSIMRPRLEDLGADIDRVKIVESADGALVDLRDDLRSIREAVAEYHPRLVILDPLNAFLGRGTDSYRDSDIRSILGPLHRMAEQNHCAIVPIIHQNKGASGNDPLLGINGSVGYGAAARTVLLVKDLGNDRRQLSLVKNSYLPENEKPKPQIFTLIGGFRWRREAPPEYETNPAEDFLRRELANGPRNAGELIGKALSLGIAERTLKRTRDEIGATTEKTRDSWVWTLDPPPGETEMIPFPGVRSDVPQESHQSVPYVRSTCEKCGREGSPAMPDGLFCPFCSTRWGQSMN